jgi:hypothetical protein
MVAHMTARVVSTLSGALLLSALVLAQSAPPPTQNPPVPRPFPGAGTPPASAGAAGAKPDAPRQAGSTAAGQTPAPPGPAQTEGGPLAPPLVYPAAEFIQDFDAGRGQRYYLYGTDQPFAAIVDYYKGVLRSNGRELSEMPAMQQFELGRFDGNTMAYPPSVVVKDYVWNGSEGYLVAQGTTPRRYRTVIQIVPAPAGR